MLAKRFYCAALGIGLLFVSGGANRHARAGVRAQRARAIALANGLGPGIVVGVNAVNRANRAALRNANADVIGNLKGAYSILSRANHDYQGHRVKAMKAIRAAGRALGVRLGGEGHVKEQQTISDKQLMQAQTLLEQTRVLAASRNLGPVAKHVGDAISHVKTALTIK